MRPHRVRMHLRRLSVSQIASFERRRAYPAARREAGRYDLPERLPDGYTFVVEYETGD